MRGAITRRSFAVVVMTSALCVLVSCVGDSEERSYKKARALWEKKEYARAADLYEAFARRFPDSPKAPSSLLKAATICSDYIQDQARAIQLHEMVLSDYPGTLEATEARLRLAGIYEEASEYSRAIVHYSALLRKEGLSEAERCRYWYKVARCYFLQGDLDNALVGYRKAVGEGGLPCQDADKASYHIGFIQYLKANFKDARKQFADLLARFPESSRVCDAMIYLARCHERLNQRAQAQEVYRRLAARCPERVEIKKTTGAPSPKKAKPHTTKKARSKTQRRRK